MKVIGISGSPRKDGNTEIFRVPVDNKLKFDMEFRKSVLIEK